MNPLPEQLKQPDIRFIKLSIRPDPKTGLVGKVPLETDWPNKHYSSDEIQPWLDAGKNYGVLCAGLIFVIDYDTPEAEAAYRHLAPKTFSVITANKKLHHDYYRWVGEGLPPNKCIKRPGNLNFDIRAQRAQVVGPGSVVTDKDGKYIGTYVVGDDEPLASMTDIQLNEIFKLDEIEVIPAPHKDESRSGEEFRLVCKLIREGKDKSQIFQRMASETKWSHEGEHYRELTYFNAQEFLCKKNVKRIQAIKLSGNDMVDDATKNKILVELINHRDAREATELVVTEIKKRRTIYSIRRDQAREMWVYQEGIFIPQGESFVKEFCRGIFGKEYSSKFLNEVVMKLEADTFISEGEFFDNQKLNVNEVCISNGILDLTTKDVSEFTEDKIFFSKLPVIYDSKATCPNIIKHLEMVLESKNDIPLMQEMIGCLLWKDNFAEMAFIFSGDSPGMDGRNGKGKTLKLIEYFLGFENCSSITIQQLEHDAYSYSHLFGKMANIAGDISPDALKTANKFKFSVGRDAFSAQRKNKEILTFTNFAKHIFACNKMPICYDNTAGFWTKWVMLNFPNMFVNQDEYDAAVDKTRLRIKDPDILFRLTTQAELSGLLNWALIGLERLKLNKGKFSNSKTADEVKKLWVRKSDSFAAFLMDNIEEEWDGKITKEELRRAYSFYCKAFKLKMSNDITIKNILTNTYSVSEERDRETGAQVPYWSGIKFKSGKDGMDGKGFSTYIGRTSPPRSLKSHTVPTVLTTSLTKCIYKMMVPCFKCGSIAGCEWEDSKQHYFCDTCGKEVNLAIERYMCDDVTFVTVGIGTAKSSQYIEEEQKTLKCDGSDALHSNRHNEHTVTDKKDGFIPQKEADAALKWSDDK